MGGSDRPPTGWRSYDSVVDEYDQAAVPRFLPLAWDLVAHVAPTAGERVLDVGTGTGLAGQTALRLPGLDGCVVGIDPSAPMLHRAAAKGVTVVAGVFPGLPFPDDVFDAVVANLVLSHLDDYRAGVADAVRVLRAGGRFGCTAWAAPVEASDEHQGPNADEIVQSILASHGLDKSPPTPPVPSEDPLRDRANLRGSLQGAGLIDVSVESSTYHWADSADEYLVGRDWRPGVRYIRELAGRQLWQDIKDRAASELRDRFGDEIRTMGHVWIAVGTKP